MITGCYIVLNVKEDIVAHAPLEMMIVYPVLIICKTMETMNVFIVQRAMVKPKHAVNADPSIVSSMKTFSLAVYAI